MLTRAVQLYFISAYAILTNFTKLSIWYWLLQFNTACRFISKMHKFDQKIELLFIHCCELVVSSSIMSKSIRFLLLVSANFLLIVLLNLKHSKNIWINYSLYDRSSSHILVCCSYNVNQWLAKRIFSSMSKLI